MMGGGHGNETEAQREVNMLDMEIDELTRQIQDYEENNEMMRQQQQ